MSLPDFMRPDFKEDCLESVFEIENVISYIQSINFKVEHLKGLKQHRIQSIDREIINLEDNINHLRKLILQTMQQLQPKQKTLNFPDVGKVSRRSIKAGWDIQDKDAVIRFFTDEDKLSEVVKVKTTESFDTKAAKKLIDLYYDSGVNVPGAQQVPASESISITFEKDKEVIIEPEEEPPVPRPKALDRLDTLDL